MFSFNSSLASGFLYLMQIWYMAGNKQNPDFYVNTYSIPYLIDI
jgi:hypothetical protein